jgi:hypothetical protein
LRGCRFIVFISESLTFIFVGYSFLSNWQYTFVIEEIMIENEDDVETIKLGASGFKVIQ